MFGAVKRVLLGVSRCLALQPDHTTLAPELPLPGYRRKETETVFAQLLENTRKKEEGWPCLHSLSGPSKLRSMNTERFRCTSHFSDCGASVNLEMHGIESACHCTSIKALAYPFFEGPKRRIAKASRSGTASNLKAHISTIKRSRGAK